MDPIEKDLERYRKIRDDIIQDTIQEDPIIQNLEQQIKDRISHVTIIFNKLYNELTKKKEE